MTQYIITAYDATDEGAAERRMQQRDAHIDTISKYKASGNMHMGAAILDGDGKMVGSSIIVEFDNDDALEAWLNDEPYVVGDVWEEITVTECKIGPSFLK